MPTENPGDSHPQSVRRHHADLSTRAATTRRRTIPAFTLGLLALLLAGCDRIQSTALGAYMAVNHYAVEDGVTEVTSQRQTFRFRALRDDLDTPWGFDFLPDGRMLVTERSGQLVMLDAASGERHTVAGVPAVHYKGQGGLLDVLVHPDFAANRQVYLSAAVRLEDGLSTTRVWRFTLDGHTLSDALLVFEATPAGKTNVHYGGALLLADGYLHITMGDRRSRHLAQDLTTTLGKTLRFTPDGAIPPDNPFATQADAQPAIYTYGHRNPQGITRDPQSGVIWTAEHGPQGGDEVNVLVPGTNYGWPVITYGEEYGGGKIGEGTAKAGLAQPLHYYVPSIGTAGLAFYDGAALPGWRNNLFVAGLRSFSISRLALRGDAIAEEERLLESFNFRIRNLRQGPDGLLYILTENGALIQVTPAG